MALVLEKPGESSTAISEKRQTIPLYLVNGVATVWDAQVAATLHCDHAISGLRVGTLPGVSQQNGFLGLPITLMQEETAYLVRSGIAHIVPVATDPYALVPSPEQVAAHTAARKERIKRIEAQLQAAAQNKERNRQQAFEKGGEKARLKREARARVKAEKAKSTESSLFEGEGQSTSLPDRPASATSPDKTAPSSNGHFYAFSALPAYPDLSLSAPITSVPHPLFPFPITPRHCALLGVFSALQARGYRTGLGPRFGGEYLVYPGDYLRYHAHFTSQVIVRDEPIKPGELVAWGRLGTGTKKAGLLCCWDDGVRPIDTEIGDEEKEGDVEFYSLEWANFG
ncbi:hypothetical protein BCR39DRAFT_277857 [Naematelia encephala]|uniref:tRNA-splicing endonuclease subunit Sen34 n=1 Tax=Naematelia encephala TaxID=71784 RepID=A0A1Y2AU43_9TREE|nr:hypothetical protein BCR39DRAFT_277857 [Naematelia encephala]